jgi:hypothetical protein
MLIIISIGSYVCCSSVSHPGLNTFIAVCGSPETARTALQQTSHYNITAAMLRKEPNKNNE